MPTPLPTPHPRAVELRNCRVTLVKRLSDAVQEIHRIKSKVLPALYAEYDNHFRALEIELQKATLISSELGRREELFRTKLERGEILSERMIEVVNAIVDKEFVRMRKRLSEAFDMTREEREERAIKRSSAHNESEFAAMYRSIVKKLHPDTSLNSSNTASPQASTLFEQFWHSAQDAYERKDIRDLQTIYDLVCMGNENEYLTDTVSIESLEREITRLEGRLRVEERKLRDLTTSEPYTLQEVMKSQTWRDAEQKKLYAQIQEHKSNAKRSQEFLISIHASVGMEWRDIPKSNETVNDEKLQNDFMENTYFNFR